MARNKNDYFALLTSQAEYAVSAASYLFDTVNDYSFEKVFEYKATMHKIEKDADTARHDIIARLSAEFITPIDQEDILRLAQITDDITDSLDETVMDMYMYSITELPEGVSDMAALSKRCVDAFYRAVSELKNFKKPTRLRELLVEVNSAESEADDRYFDAVRGLFSSEADFKRLAGHKALYDRLEECADLCEDAADMIEQIIIKNS